MREKITWDNFEEGDWLVHPSGDRARVLARCGSVFAKSTWYVYDAFSRWMTVQEAEKMGLRFVQPGNRTQMTREEIEAMMGHPIDIIN